MVRGGFLEEEDIKFEVGIIVRSWFAAKCGCQEQGAQVETACAEPGGGVWKVMADAAKHLASKERYSPC